MTWCNGRRAACPTGGRNLLFLCACALLAGPGSAVAAEPSGVVLSGEVKTTLKLIQEAQQLAAREAWADAIDALTQVLDKAGDHLVPVDADHSIQARWLCHRTLAALPPTALKLYRERVDAQARKWLEQGSARRDPQPLRRLIDETFCSRWTEDALDLLGDLAFERGDLDEARRTWRMLAGPPKDGKPPPDSLELYFPDPQRDPARVRAKLLLALLFRGEAAEFRRRLAAYRTAFPQARGKLAGREGVYADLLEELGRQPEPPALPRSDAWTTFGSHPSRQLLLPQEARDPNRLARLRPGGATFRFDLARRIRVPEAADDELTERQNTSAGAARTLAHFPIVLDDQVLVADGRYLTAYNLRDGTPEVWYDVLAAHGGFEPDLILPAAPGLRYSLSADDDAVYVRFGFSAIQPPPRDRREAKRASYLVCLGRRADERGRRERWVAVPGGDEDEGAVFEGAPLVSGGRVCAAVTRFQGANCVTAIHCYGAAAADTPPLLWRQDICATQEFRGKEQRVAHQMLTLAGPNVVYCSHTGAVVAVDLASGRRVWARRYGGPAEEADARADVPRPCLYADGRLYVAPADVPVLLCLDPQTGQLLWQRDRVEVVHLLGVARGRLIFTTVRGIRAVGVATGSDADGWRQPGDGSDLPPFGRGFLAGDLIFWPTRDGLYVLNQEDGEQPDDLDPVPLRRLRVGNLLYARGALVVAEPEYLTAYVPPALLLPGRDRQVRTEPLAPMPRYQRALALADAGQTERALEDFKVVERLATPSGPLHRQVKTARQELLLGAAAEAAGRRDWEAAAGWLGQARPPELAPAARRQALGRLGELWRAAGQAQRARSAWQELLDNPDLANGWVSDGRNLPQQAATLARVRLAELRGSPSGDPPPPRPSAWAQEGDGLPWLRRSWETSPEDDDEPLGPNEGDTGGRLLTVRDGPGGPPTALLTCRELATGAVLWRSPLPFRPCWGAVRQDLAVVAGPDLVLALNLANGATRWRYPPPDWPFRTAGRASPPFTNFCATPTRLLCRQGEGRLLALDLVTGLALWQRWAPGARLRPPGLGGRFLGAGHADDRLLLQATGGNRWLLDAGTGQTVHQAASSDPWPVPPRALDGHRLVLVPDVRHVTLLDAQDGREAWTFTLRGESTPSGRPPQPLTDGTNLVLLIDRNIGQTLLRLDPATGRPLWTEEHFLGPTELNADDLALDRTAVYADADGLLRAVSLDEGKTLWERPLPQSWAPWRVNGGPGGGLVVAPRSEVPPRFQFRWRLGALQWEGSSPPDAWGAATYPILVYDRRDGRLSQRLNLAPGGRGPERQRLFDPGSGLWLDIDAWRRPGQAPRAVVGPDGLTAVRRGRVAHWAVNATK